MVLLINLLSSLPPIFIKDQQRVIGECASIAASQQALGLWSTVTSEQFPGWDAPVDALLSPAILETLHTSSLLVAGWLVINWWNGILQQRFQLSSIADIAEFSGGQIVGTANLFLFVLGIQAVMGHTVVDIEHAGCSIAALTIAIITWRAVQLPQQSKDW